MKKLLVILLSVAALLFGEIHGAAQGPYALQYKGGKFFKGNGLVDPAQYRSLFVNEEYDDVLIGQLERKVGVGLLIGGGSSLFMGGAMFIPAVFYAERKLMGMVVIGVSHGLGSMPLRLSRVCTLSRAVP